MVELPLPERRARSRRARLSELLFGSEQVMRRRLHLCFIPAVLYVLWALGFLSYGLLHGFDNPALRLLVVMDAGGVLFYLLVRSGITRTLDDPALVLPQMLYAGAACSVAYSGLPDVRPALSQLICLVQVFGLFNLRPSALRISGFGSAAMLLVAGLVGAWLRPEEGLAASAMDAAASALMLCLLTLITAHHAQSRSRLRATRAELADAVQRTQALATRDALTGLPNRQHAQEQLQLELKRHDAGGPPLCVAFIDLDHFKGVNDTHGHAAGDAVLRQFALQARAQLREADLLARWGGEEFVAVLHGSGGLDEAVAVMDRLRASLLAHPMPLGDVVLRIGFSAGVVARQQGEPLAVLLERADQCLYRAKALGRGRTERDGPRGDEALAVPPATAQRVGSLV